MTEVSTESRALPPLEDRAVVNGAASVSAVPASVPSADFAHEVVTSAPLFQLSLSTGAVVPVHFVPCEIFPRIIETLHRAVDGWKPLSTAPFREAVEVRVGGMTLLAKLIPDSSLDEDEQSCSQWVAEREGEHPPCWSEGACWSSNEDEAMSLLPEAWRYPAQAIEARRAETGTGSVHESAVRQDAPKEVDHDPSI